MGTHASQSRQQKTFPNPFQVLSNYCSDSIRHISTVGHGNVQNLLTTVFSSLKTQLESSFYKLHAGDAVAGRLPCARISGNLDDGTELHRSRPPFDFSMSSEDIDERLQGVHAFAICNPCEDFVFISDRRKRGSLGFFCLGEDDAFMMLDRFKSMDPTVPPGSKVVPVALSKVFQLKVDGVSFRLIPEVSQISNVIKERMKFGDLGDDHIRGVPVFQSKGLVLKSQGRKYRPVFLRKEDLEKSIHRASIARKPPSRSIMSGDVEVVVLEDIIAAMKDGKTSKWNDVVFIPPGVDISV